MSFRVLDLLSADTTGVGNPFRALWTQFFKCLKKPSKRNTQLNPLRKGSPMGYVSLDFIITPEDANRNLQDGLRKGTH